MSTHPDSLIDAIKETVRTYPTTVAVDSEHRSLTYDELWAFSTSIAAALQEEGCTPGDRVGVLMDRSWELIASFLGILRFGGTLVPLAISHPDERLSHMVSDSDITVILTSSESADRARTISGHTVEVLNAANVAPENFNPTPHQSDDLAYILYTSAASGMSGPSRGVMVGHDSLRSYCDVAVSLYGLSPRERVLQFSSIAFEVAIGEIFPALLAGATLIPRPKGFIDSPQRFVRACTDWSISVTYIPSAYWHELASWIAAEAIELPPTLRLVLVGSERTLPERLLDWYSAPTQGVRLLHIYGPMESTILATWYELGPRELAGLPDVELPIGHPVGGVGAHVVNDAMIPVADGEIGELVITGWGMARGYVNDHTASNAKLPPNSLDDRSSCMCRSGDLVRRTADGALQWMGRVDQQVQVRGMRVEFGEITAALNRHPQVHTSSVRTHGTDPSTRCLAALIVPTSGGVSPSPADLKAFLQKVLPRHMVPTQYAMVSSIRSDEEVHNTSTDIGPELVLARDNDYLAASGPIENSLVELWERILGVNRVGVLESFTDLGGNSLLGLRLIAEIESTYGLEIEWEELIGGTTVRDLAVRITDAKPSNPA